MLFQKLGINWCRLVIHVCKCFEKVLSSKSIRQTPTGLVYGNDSPAGDMNFPKRKCFTGFAYMQPEL
jgi:hypothetical protein